LQRVRDRDQRDDQLGRVAEARVEEACDARTGVLTRLLGRFADHPRERNQRDRGKDEHRRLARMDGEVENDRQRRERKPCPQESARHPASLTA